MALISVVYHHFPHYREPVMRALAASPVHEYRFFGGVDNYDGIRAFSGNSKVTVEPISFLHDAKTGKIDLAGFERAVSKPFDATIIIGNINMRGTWKAVSQARRNGLATAFWSHGWLRPEPWLKAKLRNYYFSRADRVLTYGARAVQLAQKSGFDAKRIRVIGNSLDWDMQSRWFDKYKGEDKGTLRASIGMPADVPIIMTISRVTSACRYDWLIDAVSNLRKTGGSAAEIWMVGDGPELAALKEKARAMDVPLHAKGALYEEEQIAKHIMASDIVASPGKVGLTAMHSLAYGTPVITHSDFDRQMPEVEAVIEGKSGQFFTFGDVQDLSRSIGLLLDKVASKTITPLDCRTSLEGRFTPQDQLRSIDEAMSELVP